MQRKSYKDYWLYVQRNAAQTLPEMQVHWTQSRAAGAGKECGTSASSAKSDRAVALCHQSREALQTTRVRCQRTGAKYLWRHHDDIKHTHLPQTAEQQTYVFICSVLLLLTLTAGHWVNDSPRCSVTPRKRTRLQRKNRAPMTRAEVRKAFCCGQKYTH